MNESKTSDNLDGSDSVTHCSYDIDNFKGEEANEGSLVYLRCRFVPPLFDN